jgi:NTP pyrophosphatase (non-canonical NTP hydrolase)
MNFNDYQKKALTTDFTGDGGQKLLSVGYMDKVLGLVGESGEFADKMKKILRDQKGHMTATNKAELAKELGDVLWYLAVLSAYLGVDLEDLATQNIEKLAKRQKAGKLGGSGDNR